MTGADPTGTGGSRIERPARPPSTAPSRAPAGAAPGAAAARPQQAAAVRPPTAPRRTRVVIRKVGPWSVLKFSLLFYFCVMLVILLAVYILYSVMNALGTLDSLIRLLVEFSLVEKGFTLNTGWIFSRLFLFGLALVVLWSLLNVFAILLYNLISDVVGGVEVTLAERR
jgi:Transmembrane domain of unknown function (DUF3566)